MGKKFVVTNERLIVSPFHLNATYVRFACIRTILAYVASVTRMGGGGRRGRAVGIPLEFSNAFSDTVAVEFIVIFLLECALEENRKTELHQEGTPGHGY